METYKETVYLIRYTINDGSVCDYTKHDTLEEAKQVIEKQFKNREAWIMETKMVYHSN